MLETRTGQAESVESDAVNVSDLIPYIRSGKW